MQETTPWRNRIIGSGLADPEQLLANPKNWRIHPTRQQVALEAVLDEVGWVQDVIVNQRTGFLIDGHLRVSLALKHDEATIPVTYVDLSDQEESLVLASFDPIAGLAAADRDQLDALLKDVASTNPEITSLLATVAKNNGLTYAGSGQNQVQDAPPGQFVLIVTCASESAQADLYERLNAEGYRCRALVS